MPDNRKARVENHAARITNWLLDHRDEFESQGVSEDIVVASAGIEKAEEAREAIDHLESREDLVRMPQALAKPPRFLLKPGRNWPETRDRLAGTRPRGAAEAK